MRFIFLMSAVAVFVLTVPSISAAAQIDSEWVRYGSSDNGATYYYSPARVKRLGASGKVFRLWTNHTFLKPKFAFKNGTGAYTRSVNQMRLDCEQQTYSPLTTVYYDNSGETVHTDNAPEPPTPIVPGSIGEALASLVCE